MELDVRDLELLEALGQHDTLTAAAAQLYVSQPALSQRLAKIERRLGVALFDRLGRRLVPTRAGRRALQVASTALGELRHAERDIRAIRDGRSAPVVLTSQCTNNYAWLAPIIAAHRESLQGAEIRVDVGAAVDPVAALLEERIDLALITKLDPRMDRLRLMRLFDDELVTLVGLTHPWAALTSVDPHALADEHLVVFESYDPTRPGAVPLPLPSGVVPGALSALPVTTDVLIEMVSGGGSVTVLPSWIAAPYLEAGRVARVDLDAPTEVRTWYTATRQGDRTEALEALAATLEQQLTSIGPAALAA